MHDDIAPREAFRAAPLERAIDRVPRKKNALEALEALKAHTLARSVDASPLRAPLVRRPRPARIRDDHRARPRAVPLAARARVPRAEEPPTLPNVLRSLLPNTNNARRGRVVVVRQRVERVLRREGAPGVLQRAPRQRLRQPVRERVEPPPVAIITLAVINPTVNLTRWILSSGRGHPLPIAARQFREALRQRVSRRRLALGHLRPLLRRRRAEEGRVADADDDAAAETVRSGPVRFGPVRFARVRGGCLRSVSAGVVRRVEPPRGRSPRGAAVADAPKVGSAFCVPSGIASDPADDEVEAVVDAASSGHARGVGLGREVAIGVLVGYMREGANREEERAGG